jgi:hypothetical protein
MPSLFKVNLRCCFVQFLICSVLQTRQTATFSTSSLCWFRMGASFDGERRARHPSFLFDRPTSTIELYPDLRDFMLSSKAVFEYDTYTLLLNKNGTLATTTLPSTPCWINTTSSTPRCYPANLTEPFAQVVSDFVSVHSFCPDSKCWCRFVVSKSIWSPCMWTALCTDCLALRFRGSSSW